MEAFSLLKYWRTNGGASGGGGGATTIDSTANARATTETLVTASAVSPYSSDDEDGPYFDLQFALPDDHVTENEQEENEEENDKEKAQKNEINGEDETSTETESTSEDSSLNEEDEDEDENEEENSSSKDNNKAVNKIDTAEDSDEKKLIKEVVLQKYLKMVKPLYIRVSKRYLENLKFAGQHDNGGGAVTPPCSATMKAGESVKTYQKQGNNNNNLQAGLKVVRKHLGKSRSASSTVTAATPPEKMASNRRDDSLVQLQDGIQGAILHCKKSFNASRDGESSSSILCRSTSDSSSSYEKSPASTSS
ncbi:hypothetical protein ACJIZ3_001943 [Penstemon smallii]|uniref:Membrane-associated kinase regulator 2 n=1 Tax=Penstemon smallii TaxID=265156 RepID=A0ABD3U7Y1_9LAMI